jgi:hypothetical protein
MQWKLISLPFSAFRGSKKEQLDLANIKSLNFEVPGRTRGPVLIDNIRLTGITPPKSQMDLPVTFDSASVAYGLPAMFATVRRVQGETFDDFDLVEREQ